MLIIISIKKDWESLMFTTTLILIIGSMILFLPIGFEYGVDAKIIPIKCEVTKTSRLVMVDDGTKVWEFTDHESYENITDSSKFTQTLHYNMYGSVCQTDLNYSK
jgi:hypothetical protein